MATKAIHKLGDISRKPADLCVVKSYNDEFYIGQWVTGLGYVKVKFPKKTTRTLTDKEIKKFNKMSITLNGYFCNKNDIKRKDCI